MMLDPRGSEMREKFGGRKPDWTCQVKQTRMRDCWWRRQLLLKDWDVQHRMKLSWQKWIELRVATLPAAKYSRRTWKRHDAAYELRQRVLKKFKRYYWPLPDAAASAFSRFSSSLTLALWEILSAQQRARERAFALEVDTLIGISFGFVMISARLPRSL